MKCRENTKKSEKLKKKFKICTKRKTLEEIVLEDYSEEIPLWRQVHVQKLVCFPNCTSITEDANSPSRPCVTSILKHQRQLPCISKTHKCSCHLGYWHTTSTMQTKSKHFCPVVRYMVRPREELKGAKIKVKLCYSSSWCRKQECPLQHQLSIRNRKDEFIQKLQVDLQNSAKKGDLLSTINISVH